MIKSVSAGTPYLGILASQSMSLIALGLTLFLPSVSVTIAT